MAHLLPQATVDIIYCYHSFILTRDVCIIQFEDVSINISLFYLPVVSLPDKHTSDFDVIDDRERFNELNKGPTEFRRFKVLSKKYALKLYRDWVSIFFVLKQTDIFF